MKAVIKSLKTHQFFTLSFGVAAANVVSFASVPFLARLYGSEAFGIFAIYYSLYNLVGLPSTLRFELAIPIAENEDDASKLSTIALAFTFLIAATLAVSFFFDWPKQFFSEVPAGNEVWLLTALSVAVQGSSQILVQRAIRLGHMKAMSIRPIAERLCFVLFAFVAYRWQGLATGLVWAQTFALLCAMSTLIWGGRWRFRLLGGGLRAVARKYSDFPKKNLPSTFLQTVSNQVPMLIYARFFSPAELGYLSIAQRLTDAPITLLMSSITVVYYRRLLQAGRDQFRRIFVRTLCVGAMVLGPPCVIAGIFATPILDLLFGAKWAPSHMFFVVLLPLAFFKMLYMIHSSYFIVLRRLGSELYLSIGLFALQLTGIAIGLSYAQSLLFVSALAANLTAFAYLAGLFTIYWMVRKPTPA